jgi:hypothetical protein
MISEDDRRELADVVMRALDDILEEFGEDAELLGATMVAEIQVGDMFHGRYWSMPRTSPAHAIGMLHMSAAFLGAPVSDDEDDDEPETQ